MTKEKPNEKNMHAGHRARVLNSYSRIDLDALSPHQVLEFILFYVFPRGDVNPLAHRLLDKFGTVQNVLDATPNDLAKVYGISKHSAQMIAGFSKIFNYYTRTKLAKKFSFKTYDELYDYCEELLRLHSNEVMFAIALDASSRLISKRMLGKGGVDLVSVDTHELCDYINETRAAYILFVHSHPGGYCTPTENDVEGNKILVSVLEYMNAKFVDHLIVGDDGIFSINENRKVRSFSNT